VLSVSGGDATIGGVGEPSADAGNRSWWQTLPGILTAIAALLSAITGLIVAVRQLRSDNDGSPAAPAAATANPDNTSAGQAVSGESEITPNAGASTRYAVRFPSGVSARVGASSYQILRAHAASGNPGEIDLALRVRMTNQSAYPANFWSRTFRVRVGADTSAPTNFLDEVVEGGTTKTGAVDFTLPAAARRAALLVGDDPAKAVALPVRVAVRK
jgi:hypothetical protein